MDEKISYWASVAFGAVALVLLVVNVSAINSDQNMQREIMQRQAVINKGANYNQANQALVQALADLSVSKKNTAVRDLLAAQGITIKQNEAKAETKPEAKPDETAAKDRKKKDKERDD